MQGHAILGISLGSRSLGIAVMRDGKLVDWQVKSFTDTMTQQKLHIITGALLRVVKDHHIGSVAIKVPLALEMHANLVSLKRHLVKALASRSIPIQWYTLSEIKSRLGIEVRNKVQLATCMVAAYPELRFVFMKQQDSRNSYYLKLFEAVAVLHIHITGT